MTEDRPWWREQFPDQPDLWKPYEDFRVFLVLVWKFLNLPVPTPIQMLIAGFIQHCPRRVVIMAFRGIGKSWITAAYVCWRLLRNPQYKIMVVSASKERADNFTTFTLLLIQQMPILQHLYPRSDQRCSKVSFDVAGATPDQTPSVRSVGILGQLTGGRADEIIADDVEVPNNSATQGMQDKLSEAVKEFDAVLKPGGRVKYLGTPQTEQSLYKKVEERGYIVRIWPAHYPNQKQIEKYGERLSPEIAKKVSADPTLVGKTTDPRRFSDEDLMERMLSYGRSGFALQFMLDTSLSDADRYPLKLRDLIVTDFDMLDQGPEKVIWSGGAGQTISNVPCVGLSGDRYQSPMSFYVDAEGRQRFMPWSGSVMAIDPSGRGKDETGIAILKMLNSQLFCPFASGLQGGYSPENLERIANLAKAHKVNLILIESNFGDGMFAALLKPYLQRIYPCTIEEVRSSTQKEKRIIDTLEPVMNQHRLIFDRKVIEQDWQSTQDRPEEERLRYQLFYQMTRITKDRGSLVKDDRLDALAMAVAYWVEQMAMERDKALEDRHAEMLQADLDRFMEHALGRPSDSSRALWTGR